MISETNTRYEVRYEDNKGYRWYRGKESGLYGYEDAKRYASELREKERI